MTLRLPKFIPLVLLILCSCTPESDKPAASATIETWLPLSIEGIPIEAQVAITRTEMSRGLMYRESLGPDRGMLFPYRQPEQMSFWMANTPLPLDIGFFDSEGILKEIHRMYPYDTNKTRSRSSGIQFALEMNSGWFADNSLFPGARLDLEAVSRALHQRGVDPGSYGLGGG